MIGAPIIRKQARAKPPRDMLVLLPVLLGVGRSSFPFGSSVSPAGFCWRPAFDRVGWLSMMEDGPLSSLQGLTGAELLEGMPVQDAVDRTSTANDPTTLTTPFAETAKEAAITYAQSVGELASVLGMELQSAIIPIAAELKSDAVGTLLDAAQGVKERAVRATAVLAGQLPTSQPPSGKPPFEFPADLKAVVRTEIEQIRAEYVQLQESISQQDDFLQQLQGQLEAATTELKASMDSAQMSIAATAPAADIERLRQSIDQQDSYIGELQAQLLSASAELHEAATSMRETMATANRAELQGLQAEYAKLLQTVEGQDAVVTELQERLRPAATELGRALESVEQSTGPVAVAVAQAADTQSLDVQRLQMECAQLLQAVGQQDDLIGTLQAQVQSATAELAQVVASVEGSLAAAATVEVRRLKDEYAALEQAIERQDSYIHQLQAQALSTAAELSSTVASMQESIDMAAQEQVRLLQTEYTELQHAIGQQDGYIAQLEAQLQSTGAELQAAMDNVRESMAVTALKRVELLENEYAALQTAVGQQDAYIAQLEARLQSTGSELKAAIDGVQDSVLAAARTEVERLQASGMNTFPSEVALAMKEQVVAAADKAPEAVIGIKDQAIAAAAKAPEAVAAMKDQAVAAAVKAPDAVAAMHDQAVAATVKAPEAVAAMKSQAVVAAAKVNALYNTPGSTVLKERVREKAAAFAANAEPTLSTVADTTKEQLVAAASALSNSVTALIGEASTIAARSASVSDPATSVVDHAALGAAQGAQASVDVLAGSTLPLLQQTALATANAVAEAAAVLAAGLQTAGLPVVSDTGKAAAAAGKDAVTASLRVAADSSAYLQSEYLPQFLAAAEKSGDVTTKAAAEFAAELASATTTSIQAAMVAVEQSHAEFTVTSILAVALLLNLRKVSDLMLEVLVGTDRLGYAAAGTGNTSPDVFKDGAIGRSSIGLDRLGLGNLGARGLSGPEMARARERVQARSKQVTGLPIQQGLGEQFRPRFGEPQPFRPGGRSPVQQRDFTQGLSPSFATMGNVVPTASGSRGIGGFGAPRFRGGFSSDSLGGFDGPRFEQQARTEEGAGRAKRFGLQRSLPIPMQDEFDRRDLFRPSRMRPIRRSIKTPDRRDRYGLQGLQSNPPLCTVPDMRDRFGAACYQLPPRRVQPDRRDRYGAMPDPREIRDNFRRLRGGFGPESFRSPQGGPQQYYPRVGPPDAQFGSPGRPRGGVQGGAQQYYPRVGPPETRSAYGRSGGASQYYPRVGPEMRRSYGGRQGGSRQYRPRMETPMAREQGNFRRDGDRYSDYMSGEYAGDYYDTFTLPAGPDSWSPEEPWSDSSSWDPAYSEQLRYPRGYARQGISGGSQQYQPRFQTPMAPEQGHFRRYREGYPTGRSSMRIAERYPNSNMPGPFTPRQGGSRQYRPRFKTNMAPEQGAFASY